MRLLFLLALAGSVAAQTGTLVGTVLDEEGDPLSGATVYLSGTTRGDATDADGRYEIADVPPGVYRLVASMVGFEPIVEEVALEDRTRVATDFLLYTARRTVGFIRVEAPRDRRWMRHRARFEEAFLGESARADSVEVLNPEVLEFQERMGVLQAVAAKPLVIENRALGYRLTYDLRAFAQSAEEVRYDGDVRFEEMAPPSARDSVRWRQARLAAYRGSLQHLLRSLVEDDLEGSGFLLTLDESRREIEDTMDMRPSARPARRRDIYRPDRAGGGRLGFRGRLVVRFPELEDPAFVTSALVRGDRRQPGGEQRSVLELRADAVRLDERGTPASPLDVYTRGYLGFERLADLVPDDYEPDRP